MKIQTKTKKIFFYSGILLFFFLALFLYLARFDLPFLPNNARYSNAEVNVQFINVGQGDCELIQDHDKTVLIDGGVPDQGANVVRHLHKQGIKKIDIMIGTHPHSDHIGGLIKVMQEIPTSMLILPEIPQELLPTTRTYSDFLSTASAKHVQVVKAQAGNDYPLSRGVLHILGPVAEYDDLDCYSVIAKFTDGDVSFLFTGDAKKDSEEDLIDSGQDLRSLVLKVGHHGSNTSTTDEFLAAVNPKCCVISVGKDNPYGHPSPEVLERLSSRKVYRTDINGTIIMESDTKQVDIKTRKD